MVLDRLAGLHDANGHPTTSGFGTIFDDAEFFTAIESRASHALRPASTGSSENHPPVGQGSGMAGT